MEAELEQTVMRPDAGARGHGGSGGRAGELRACVESGRGRLAGARAGAVACADARVEGPGSGGVERLGGRVAGSLRVVWGGRRWPAVAGEAGAAAAGARARCGREWRAQVGGDEPVEAAACGGGPWGGSGPAGR
jgi:hypothetical protein